MVSDIDDLNLLIFVSHESIILNFYCFGRACAIYPMVDLCRLQFTTN